MSDEEKKPVAFPIPYQMVVESETAIRSKSDFWRFRVLSNILRQTPRQIEQFQKRYENCINETGVNSQTDQVKGDES